MFDFGLQKMAYLAGGCISIGINRLDSYICLSIEHALKRFSAEIFKQILDFKPMRIYDKVSEKSKK